MLNPDLITIQKNTHLPDEFFYILYDGDVVGEFNIKVEDKIFWLCSFAIFVEHRGTGLGKLGLAAIIKFSEKYNVEEMRLFVDFQNEVAQHVYLMAGFRLVEIHRLTWGYSYEMSYKYGKEMPMEQRLENSAA